MCVERSRAVTAPPQIEKVTDAPGLSDWREEGSLPVAVSGPGVVGGEALNGVLLVGGLDPSGIATNAVQLGTLGATLTWQQAASLPGVGRHGSCVAKTFASPWVYVLGGETSDGQRLDEVIVGELGPTGAITWKLSAPMPIKRARFGCVIH